MKKYSKEFKDSTVQLIINNNENVKKVAKDLDINPVTLYSWVTAYKKDGQNSTQGLKATKKFKSSLI